MRTVIVVALFCTLALAGCNKSADYSSAPAPTDSATPPQFAAAPGRVAMDKPATGEERPRQKQMMAYSHAMWLVVDTKSVLAHFQRARDRCLNDAALNCVLLGGTANAGDEAARQPPAAELIVTLPHEQVAVFQKGLLAPLAGHPGEITVRSQTVEAENVTQQVMDIDRRVAQLSGYRDRLTAIAERPNIKAEDLIPLEEKISELQSTLDELATQKAAIGERVRTERLTVTFTARASVTETERPIAQAWDNSYELLGNSVSAVLTILIILLPWVPVAGLIWFVVWLVRRNKRRRAALAPPAAAPPATPPAP